MPYLPRSTYPGPPWYQWNGHWQTILPAFAPVPAPYERERLELADGDFLDLDWLVRSGRRRLLVLTHGLEGNSNRPYIQRPARYFYARGWDILAWNCRSCSGEMNRLPRLYHHGEIEDIEAVVRHALGLVDYGFIALAGYSMGGSINTKFLAVRGRELPPLRASVAFSSPFWLDAGVDALEAPGNAFYKKRFLRSLGKKLANIESRFPGTLEMRRLAAVKTWRDFDNWFTAPLLGLERAEDFYEMASAANYLSRLRRPALLVNALNDPIIPRACSPREVAESHPHFFLEEPARGGHVGFALARKPHSWMEERLESFLAKIVL